MRLLPGSLSAFTMLLFCLVPAMLYAGTAKDDEYTIKKGDTLWNISNERFKDPLLWKKLWKANSQIKNPDLILPGQKLTIPDGYEQPEKINSHDTALPAQQKPGQIIIPEKAMPQKIPAVQTSYIVPKEILLQGGYIRDNVTTAGRISGSPEGRQLIGRGDYVYITTDKPAALNTYYYIASAPQKIIHPSTSVIIGEFVKVKGVLKIIGEDNGNKKAVILESFEEITTDDMLTDFYPVEMPVMPAIERRPAISGTIVKIWNEHGIANNYDILYFDKGTKDGIEIGDAFDIISSNKPNIKLGAVQVISTADNASAAIIKKAVSEIKIGDLLRN